VAYGAVPAQEIPKQKKKKKSKSPSALRMTPTLNVSEVVLWGLRTEEGGGPGPDLRLRGV